MDWLTWVQVVEVPIIGALFGLIFRHRAVIDGQIVALGKDVARVRSSGAHELAEYKLAVAKEYASVDVVGAMEKRMIAHLERIEDKLDRRALING